MAYNEKNDKLIKLFEYGDCENGGSLQFSIFSYNGNPAKIQMTRMYKKKNGEYGYGKVGRLSIEEMKYLQENIKEIINCMEVINK